MCQDPFLKPLSEIAKLTEKQSATLLSKGISTPLELLKTLPLRFEDRRYLAMIEGLKAGKEVHIQGRIVQRRYAKRQLYLTLDDGSGLIRVILFHCYYSVAQKLSEGVWLLCYAPDFKPTPQGPLLLHPKWRLLSEPLSYDKMIGQLEPYYGQMGIPAAKMQSLVQSSLDYLKTALDACDKPLWQAFGAVHKPPSSQEGAHQAKLLIAIEEFSAHLAALESLKLQNKTQPALPHADPNKALQAVEQSLKHLPFTPTEDQSKLWEKLALLLADTQAQTYLIQGDVGSGKTLLGFWAALYMAQGGLKTILLCPTTILAKQHFETFQSWLKPFGTPVYLLIAQSKAAERKKVQKALQDEPSCVVICTHAIFHLDYSPSNLGLMIIDEQQRFGVEQRMSFLSSDQRKCPHQLMLSATPIPRTLAQALYGEQGYGILANKPLGRKPIETRALSQDKLESVIASVQNYLAQSPSNKAFWVCPRIESDEEGDLVDLKARHELLVSRIPFATLLHGAMKDSEKLEVVQAFESGHTRLLVSTTVIETGIDIEGANLIVIEHAERFGLSQLHQLRGRVGRREQTGHCILLYKPPLSAKAETRLASFRNCQDGFELASLDLQQRGQGNLLGTEQSGQHRLMALDYLSPMEAFNAAQEKLNNLTPCDKQRLINRWIGQKLEYVRA